MRVCVCLSFAIRGIVCCFCHCITLGYIQDLFAAIHNLTQEPIMCCRLSNERYIRIVFDVGCPVESMRPLCLRKMRERCEMSGIGAMWKITSDPRSPIRNNAGLLGRSQYVHTTSNTMLYPCMCIYNLFMYNIEEKVFLCLSWCVSEDVEV